MADIVVMPKLGLLMETGTVGAWKVAEGEGVAVGQVIAEITTEKIVYELESQVEGTLLKIILPDEGEAPVGEPIAIIGEPSEDISGLVGPVGAGGEGRTPEAGEAGGPAAGGTAVLPATAVTVRAPGERIVASPAAKKLAAELGVDLTLVAGSGPSGRVTLEDVTAAAQQSAGVADVATAAGAPTGAVAQAGSAPAFATPTAEKMAAEMGVDLAAVSGSGVSGRVKAEDVARAAAAGEAPAGGATPAAGAAAPGVAPPSAAGSATVAGAAADIRGGVLQEIPYAGMRRLIGEHMDASRKIAPTVTYAGTADVQKLKDLVAQINATRPEDDKVNVTAATVKAVALSLERMPKFNATLEGEMIKVWRNINVGVAVALNDGLIVPVIREANRKGLVEIAREIKSLAGRARENKLLPDDVSGGTFTVTTVGSYRSVDYFSPIINQPEAAILGVGRMRETVVAVDGRPAVHAAMGLSLTCDHRMIDGAPAAEFLRILMDYLEEPLTILV